MSTTPTSANNTEGDLGIQANHATIAANRLSTIAIAFSIVAIVTAYVQFVLSSESSSNALRKTNRAAIGPLEKHRLLVPTWRRIKILYPVVSLKLEDLVNAAHPMTDTGESHGSDFVVKIWQQVKGFFRILVIRLIAIVILVASWRTIRAVYHIMSLKLKNLKKLGVPKVWRWSYLEWKHILRVLVRKWRRRKDSEDNDVESSQATSAGSNAHTAQATGNYVSGRSPTKPSEDSNLIQRAAKRFYKLEWSTVLSPDNATSSHVW